MTQMFKGQGHLYQQSSEGQSQLYEQSSQMFDRKVRSII